MMYALVIYCVASLASATAHDWPFFLATRIVAGLGTGAESAIVAPFLSEFVARRYRGAFHRQPCRLLLVRLRGGCVARLSRDSACTQCVARGDGDHRAADRDAALVAARAARIAALARGARTGTRRPRPSSPRAEAELTAAGVKLEPLPDTARPPSRVPVAAERASALANVKALWSRKLARITAMTWLMWLSITFSYYAFLHVDSELCSCRTA